jgi:RNA polymerase sigma-70 factor, ECF subfamily
VTGGELVAAAKAGDMAAFGELYRVYQPKVMAMLLWCSRDVHLSEDLCQETFRRALAALPTLSYERGDVSGWLLTIARNLWRDHQKSIRVRKGLEVPCGVVVSRDGVGIPEPTPSPDVADLVIARESVARARGLLRELSAQCPDQAECVRLRFFDGLSRAETAAAMGRGGPAVMSLQHRALRNLARMAAA